MTTGKSPVYKLNNGIKMPDPEKVNPQTFPQIIKD
jgi:hypothetical protein